MAHLSRPPPARRVISVNDTPDREGLIDVACCRNSACCAGPAPTVSARGAWPLDSLTHALLHCRAIHPAVQWLTELWTRVDGSPGPPTTASVWLQADTIDWKPRRDHEVLWTTLRTSLLAAAWGGFTGACAQPERLRERRRRLRPSVVLRAPTRRRGPRARRAVALGTDAGQVFPPFDFAWPLSGLRLFTSSLVV
jgi:hypothetical protein